MKPLNLKFINLLIILTLFFSFKGISQSTLENTNNIMETIVASGNDATGISGTVTYSIGQVFYAYNGETDYNVSEGIQFAENNTTLDVAENSIEPTTEIFIFPNPTTDFVNVDMKGFELENSQRSYQLYDLQGRLLKQNEINQDETQIDLNDLSSSIYMLQVYADNKVLKTFKILKN